MEADGSIPVAAFGEPGNHGIANLRQRRLLFVRASFRSGEIRIVDFTGDEPEWDPLRGDPCFNKIVAALEPDCRQMTCRRGRPQFAELKQVIAPGVEANGGIGTLLKWKTNRRTIGGRNAANSSLSVYQRSELRMILMQKQRPDRL